MEWMLPASTALLLGSMHAFEADHLAAVGAFAVRRPRAGAAIVFGLRWALGHGAVLVLLGTAMALLGPHLPPVSGSWLERVVGLSLVALGGWTALGARSLHAHRHTHADGTTHVHLHSHALGDHHRHGHAATAIGALHGLAGTAPALALVPLAGSGSAAAAAAALLAFAVGTAVAMALYAMIAGFVAGRAALRSVRVARGVAVVTGLATALVGLHWMLR